MITEQRTVARYTSKKLSRDWSLDCGQLLGESKTFCEINFTKTGREKHEIKMMAGCEKCLL